MSSSQPPPRQWLWGYFYPLILPLLTHDRKAEGVAWSQDGFIIPVATWACSTGLTMGFSRCLKWTWLLLCACGNLSVSPSGLILVNGMCVVGIRRKWVCPRLYTCWGVELLVLGRCVGTAGVGRTRLSQQVDGAGSRQMTSPGLSDLLLSISHPHIWLNN